ncbi:MAG: cellulase family glycosylhydrolase [Planctomycetaceae bacterium]
MSNGSALLLLWIGSLVGFAGEAGQDRDAPSPLERIRVSDDGKRFVGAESGEPFVVWGVNYDHDGPGRLIEDYWLDDWQTVEEDFQEIKTLGANTVRVHLQLPKFMDSATKSNRANLSRLAQLVRLAEQTGLYLDLTGLGCYHKQDVPAWYDELSEADRWEVQARFWRAVAEVCRTSPAVFCYDLMNEPILPGQEPASEWLTGELGGKFFVQRISLDLAGRTRTEVARAWVAQLTSAIRDVDDRHLITVGVIPWALTFKGAKPLFHSAEVGEPLDFVAVHFYPKSGEIEEAQAALAVYEVGKPLLVEEIFPLGCSIEEVDQFISGSRGYADGWISFYWGDTIEDLEERSDFTGALVAAWLRHFRDHAPVTLPANSR